MTEKNTYDDIDIKRKRERERKLIARLVIGEIIIFLLFSVMLYFYNKSKYKNILINAIVLFIHLQTILLGVLYTYYYELKNNIKDRYRFNNNEGGYVALFFICMFLIITCFFMTIISIDSIEFKLHLQLPLSSIFIRYIIPPMLVTYIILYFYITTYKKFVINPLYG